VVRSYRSRDDIVIDILTATTKVVKKTHIMQRANLNPMMFRKYFPKLVENGLIFKKNDPNGGFLYGLSSDGKELLKMYTGLRARFPMNNDNKPVYVSASVRQEE
jgi:predicted transcriptional regulator